MLVSHRSAPFRLPCTSQRICISRRPFEAARLLIALRRWLFVFLAPREAFVSLSVFGNVASCRLPERGRLARRSSECRRSAPKFATSLRDLAQSCMLAGSSSLLRAALSSPSPPSACSAQRLSARGYCTFGVARLRYILSNLCFLSVLSNDVNGFGRTRAAREARSFGGAGGTVGVYIGADRSAQGGAVELVVRGRYTVQFDVMRATCASCILLEDVPWP
mmetsp:Transcript_30680/g.67194  ORF Transcript_30680/g.67194 Transcript_30680/m.67194 type:complete len:220 (+) Transcript_30680:1766-2425(+)